jgi:hypothetical protein
MQVEDYHFCAEICQQLISKSHTIGWQVVQKLGQCQKFDNYQLRCDLLAFALLYCPIDVIELLINTRSVYESCIGVLGYVTSNQTGISVELKS